MALSSHETSMVAEDGKATEVALVMAATVNHGS
jgi:hypothetical protein